MGACNNSSVAQLVESRTYSKTGIKNHSFRFVLQQGPESVRTPKAAREKRVNYNETLSRSDKQPMP